MFNPITLMDGYKLDHRRQYPSGTQFVYSNFTPRGSRIPGINKVIFVGLQYFLGRYMMEEMQNNFFNRPVDEICDEYQKMVDGYLGPNDIGTDHIRALHNLGYVPLEFCALPEGTPTPLRVPMFTVVNTHPDFFWLVNYFETIVSAVVWQPCTSATIAQRYRKMFEAAAKETGSDLGFVDFQGHDFSMRGMGGGEAAAISGLGHLTAFKGTDTIPSTILAQKYYPSSEGHLVGTSVAATEHSTETANIILEANLVDEIEEIFDEQTNTWLFV